MPIHQVGSGWEVPAQSGTASIGAGDNCPIVAATVTATAPVGSKRSSNPFAQGAALAPAAAGAALRPRPPQAAAPASGDEAPATSGTLRYHDIIVLL